MKRSGIQGSLLSNLPYFASFIRATFFCSTQLYSINMHQDFIVRKWSVWPPLEGSELNQAELLSSVPKMLKRRLSPLARIVFSVVSQCVETNNQQIPIVFSSTHGELARSFNMMEKIEAGEEISPTSFSLSVHNAIAGLISMVYKNKLQSKN